MRNDAPKKDVTRSPHGGGRGAAKILRKWRYPLLSLCLILSYLSLSHTVRAARLLLGQSVGNKVGHGWEVLHMVLAISVFPCMLSYVIWRWSQSSDTTPLFGTAFGLTVSALALSWILASAQVWITESLVPMGQGVFAALLKVVRLMNGLAYVAPLGIALLWWKRLRRARTGHPAP